MRATAIAASAGERGADVGTRGASSAEMTSTLTPHPRLVVRWFVQYNPFFTASALCVLGGILLARQALGSSADVALTIVLELYQALVIAIAALLYRRLLERRPAAILGVIALVFLVDPTLQLSALAASHAFAMSAVWLVLFALKWRALQWSFHLRLSGSAKWLPLAAAALMVAKPISRVLSLDERLHFALPLAIAAVVFAIGVVAVFAPMRAESTTMLGEVGLVMFPRLARAAVVVGVAGVSYQLANTMFSLGLDAALPSVGAAALVAAMSSKKLPLLIVCSWIALIAFANAGYLGYGCIATAFALILTSRSRAPFVLVAAALFAYVGAVGNFALPSSTSTVVASALVTAILVWSLVRRRAWSAVPALALLHVNALITAWSTFAPSSRGTWGLIALAAGFVLLPAGVVLQRRLSRALAILEQTTPSLPTESVSIGIARL